MGHVLEANGFEKNPQKNEKFLRDCLDDYKLNQHKLTHLMAIRVGFDGGADARGIGEVENAINSLRNTILKTAQELGRDGSALIAEADEEVRRIQEKPKAA